MKDEGKFPLYLWAAMVVENQTSNACEAFHSHLSTYFHNPLPDITLFIIGLKALQGNTEMFKNTADTNAHVTDHRIKRCRATINANIQKYRHLHIKWTTVSACSFVEKVIMEFIVITGFTNKINFTVSNFSEKTLGSKVVDF